MKVLVKERRIGESFRGSKALAAHDKQSPVKEFFHSVKVPGIHSFTSDIEETATDHKTQKDISCYCLPAAVGETFERFYTYLDRNSKTRGNRDKKEKYI
ncbi:MAG: hypothetical protein Q4B03_05360 [Lachnospiraceae bacterium]|nr:hypothetical protein [Lachnospiraceae bacterium]